MEGFKTLPKGVPCYKEGGSVYKSRHAEKSEMSEDIAKDKKVVKKAFAMHDKQEHPGEKTDLSKLKKGGRAKKCGGGTVNRYKAGGSVTNVYEAKKTSGDKDNIRKTKDITPSKAAAPSKAATKPNFAGSDVAKQQSMPSGHEDPYIKSKQSGKAAAAPSGAGGPDAFKKGGKVKKFSGVDGSYVGMSKPANTPSAPVTMAELEKQRNLEKMARAQKYLGPAQQSELIKQDPRAAGLTGNIGYKKGGKVCYSEGGSLKETNAEENPGLAKLPTEVRNKMGYMKKGGKAKKMMSGGTCS
jgi:hypothetical protein